MTLLAFSTMTLPDHSNALYLTSQTTLEILMISEEDYSKVRLSFGMKQTMNTSSTLIMTLEEITTQLLTSSTPSPVTPPVTARKKLASTSLTRSPFPRSTTQQMASSILTMRSPPPSKNMSSNADAEMDL